MMLNKTKLVRLTRDTQLGDSEQILPQGTVLKQRTTPNDENMVVVWAYRQPRENQYGGIVPYSNCEEVG